LPVRVAVEGILAPFSFMEVEPSVTVVPESNR